MRGRGGEGESRWEGRRVKVKPSMGKRSGGDVTLKQGRGYTWKELKCA